MGKQENDKVIAEIAEALESYNKLIEKIAEPSSPSDEEPPEETALLEQNRIEHEAEQHACELRNERYKQDTKERRRYAKKVFCYLQIWTIGVGMVVILAGLGYMKLSDNVLIAIISGSTIKIIGLFAIVVRNLFPGQKDS